MKFSFSHGQAHVDSFNVIRDWPSLMVKYRQVCGNAMLIVKCHPAHVSGVFVFPQRTQVVHNNVRARLVRETGDAE